MKFKHFFSVSVLNSIIQSFCQRDTLNFEISDPKPRLLVFSSFFTPSLNAGGPVKSLENLLSCLHDIYNICIVTSNHDLGETTTFPGIDSYTPLKHKGYTAIYISRNFGNFIFFVRLFLHFKPDLIYLNSFFDFNFSIIPFSIFRFLPAKSKMLIAPRGEFSPGALNIKSFKKNLFLSLAAAAYSSQRIRFHATACTELLDILQAMKCLSRKSVYIANNISPSDSPSLIQARGLKKRQSLSFRSSPNLIYLSRIVPKKNLLFLLQALMLVKHPLCLSIFGPKEDLKYWRACERVINSLPSHIHVYYRSSVDPENVLHCFALADLFVFPTLGENYGHVILESLSVGTPVIISANTPWKESENLGVSITALDSPESLAMLISNYCTSSREERSLLSIDALNYWKTVYDDCCTEYPSIRMFSELLKCQ